MSPRKAVGAAWDPERAPGLAGFPGELREPFGGTRWRVWFRKWSKVAVPWGGDLTLVPYLESKH